MNREGFRSRDEEEESAESLLTGSALLKDGIDDSDLGDPGFGVGGEGEDRLDSFRDVPDRDHSARGGDGDDFPRGSFNLYDCRRDEGCGFESSNGSDGSDLGPRSSVVSSKEVDTS